MADAASCRKPPRTNRCPGIRQRERDPALVRCSAGPGTRSSRPPDAALRGLLRDVADERRRFGYRRLFVLLRRKASRRGSAGLTAFIARKGSPSASGGLAGRLWGPRAPILARRKALAAHFHNDFA